MSIIYSNNTAVLQPAEDSRKQKDELIKKVEPQVGQKATYSLQKVSNYLELMEIVKSQKNSN